MTLRGTVIARHVRDQLTQAGYPLLKASLEGVQSPVPTDRSPR
jgi:hypothetical protein